MINFVNGRAGTVEHFQLTVGPELVYNSPRQLALGSAYHLVASVNGGSHCGATLQTLFANVFFL